MMTRDAYCVQCESDLSYGDWVIPVGRVAHRGNVSTEVIFNDMYAHIRCVTPVEDREVQL